MKFRYWRRPSLAIGLLTALSALAVSSLVACSGSDSPSTAAGGQAPAAGAPSSAGAGGNAVTAGSAGTSSTVAGGGAGQAGAAGAVNAGAGAAGQLAAGGSAMGGAPGSSAGAAAGGAPTAGSGAGGSNSAGGAAGAGFVDLFNGTDLTGFDVYKQTTEKAPGTHLTMAQALPIFRPENGMIHVYADAPDQSPQVHYTLVTTKSYSKYILTWEYKWGTKKFAPYTDLVKYPRDAGVLWHLHGDLTQLWPASMEFQNKFGSTGDIYALYARCTSPGSASDKTVFAEGGASVLVDGSNGFVQHSRSANFEVADGWTPLVLQVDGNSAVYTVNGHIVNRVLSVLDKDGKPVTSGPIAWQAEQAEVFYRNLRIQVLP